MTIKMKTLLTCLLFSTGVLLFSCKKDGSVQNPSVTEEESIAISEENTAADAEFDDVTEIGFSAGADLEVSTDPGEVPGSGAGSASELSPNLFEELSFKTGPCTKITVIPNDNTFPKTVIVDYGDGCFCRDGKFRKGAIVLHFSAPIRRPGAVLTITLRNYFVNRVHFEGTKTIKNLSENGVHKFSVNIENGKVTWPNGRGFKYEAVKLVTQVRGMETRTIRDDVYEIEGRAKTVYSNGTTVTKNTETPLIKKITCPWIVKGVVKIKINERVFYIDFGNGECDNKAILKWEGGEKEIRLP